MPKSIGDQPEVFLALNREIGTRLRAYRLRRGWNQSEMAAYLNRRLGTAIGLKAVSSWETGFRTIPAAVWFACFEEADRDSTAP